MRKVILLFPDTSSLADFILTYSIGKAEVNSWEQTLCATLTEDEITKACTEFGAEIRQQFYFTPR